MENNENKNEESRMQIAVRPYSLTELAKIYGVGNRTLKKWINEFKSEVGEKKGRFYTIPQVKIIFKNLCFPHTMDPTKDEKP